jgi:hypothetical protein
MRRMVLPLALVGGVACARSSQPVTPSQALFNQTVECVLRVATAASFAEISFSNFGDWRTSHLVAATDTTESLSISVRGRRTGKIYLLVPYLDREPFLLTSRQRETAATARQMYVECSPEGVPTIYTIDQAVDQYVADGRINDADVAEALHTQLNHVARSMTRTQHSKATSELMAFIDYVDAQSGNHIDAEAALALAQAAHVFIEYYMDPRW